MSATTTMKVPHLGGITAGYRMSGDKYDATKPTSVLINSMCTTVSLFDEMFANTRLRDTMNLLAIEPLGHGATSCPSEHFTYWDSAIMALQVLEYLGIDRAFALGASQGGWIVVRMALLAPDRILGLMPTGTSMDSESEDSRSKGAWNPKPLLIPFVEKWCSMTPTPDFVIDDVWCGMVADLGFPKTFSEKQLQFWNSTLKSVYNGDKGRKKVKGALVCLLERDGLLLRIRDIKCPVYWLQGTQDIPFGVILAKEQIRLFTSSEEARLDIIEGGSHYLNASNPIEVADKLLELVKSYTQV